MDLKKPVRFRGVPFEFGDDVLIVPPITCDQAEALAISDRIVVIEKGRIVQIGSPLELYRSPGNRFYRL